MFDSGISFPKLELLLFFKFYKLCMHYEAKVKRRMLHVPNLYKLAK